MRVIDDNTNIQNQTGKIIIHLCFKIINYLQEDYIYNLQNIFNFKFVNTILDKYWRLEWLQIWSTSTS